jgi:hypothetical protein
MIIVKLAVSSVHTAVGYSRQHGLCGLARTYPTQGLVGNFAASNRVLEKCDGGPRKHAAIASFWTTCTSAACSRDYGSHDDAEP